VRGLKEGGDVVWRRPPLTVAQILAWADAHHARTGQWPRQYSGPVAGADGENWAAINNELWQGLRGLPGGDSLERLLGRYRRPGQHRGPRPWTPEEDELVRTLPTQEVARRTGRTTRAVYNRRRRLGSAEDPAGT
jgi:hypothetical protein